LTQDNDTNVIDNAKAADEAASEARLDLKNNESEIAILEYKIA
jgi:hypothetical protein